MIIEVPPRIKEYEPYAYWLLGAPRRGCAGQEDITRERLSRAWLNMMQRCYDEAEIGYKHYGAKGVSVCKRWHTVARYIEDVQLIHGWSSKLADWKGYSLDKDYYSSNQYSPDTCIWLSISDNNALQGMPVYVTNTIGTRVLYLTLTEASRALATTCASIRLYLANGAPLSNRALRGYKFELATDAEYMRHSLT